MSSCSILHPCREIKLQQQHAAFNSKPMVLLAQFPLECFGGLKAMHWSDKQIIIQ